MGLCLTGGGKDYMSEERAGVLRQALSLVKSKDTAKIPPLPSHQLILHPFYILLGWCWEQSWGVSLGELLGTYLCPWAFPRTRRPVGTGHEKSAVGQTLSLWLAT